MSDTLPPPPAEQPVDPRALHRQLQERFPVFRDFLPLAIGIDKQLFDAVPEVSRKNLRLVMRSHTLATRYLKAMEKATARVNLDGTPAGEVTDDARQHAATQLKERYKKQAEQRRAEQAANQAEQRRQEKLLQLADRFGRKER